MVGMLGCACCPGCAPGTYNGGTVDYWDSLFQPDYPTSVSPPVGWCYNDLAGVYIEQTRLSASFYPMTLHADADTITSDGTKSGSDDYSGCRSLGPLKTADHTVWLEADNLTAGDNKFGLFTQVAGSAYISVSDRTGSVVYYDSIQTTPGSSAGLAGSFTKIRMELAMSSVTITSTPAGGNWVANATIQVRVWLDDVLDYDQTYTTRQIKKCGAAAAIFYKTMNTWTINDFSCGVT